MGGLRYDDTGLHRHCTGTDNDGERMGDVDHSRLTAYRLLLTVVK